MCTCVCVCAAFTERELAALEQALGADTEALLQLALKLLKDEKPFKFRQILDRFHKRYDINAQVTDFHGISCISIPY